MARTVRLTQSAVDDLVNALEWIAKDNAIRGQSFVGLLRAKCLALAEEAEMWPRLGASPDLRIRNFRNYKIIFRIIDQTVEILHVAHGARALDLSPDEESTAPE